MSYKIMDTSCILTAYNRIKSHIVSTPILSSPILNNILKSNIFFKFEGAQEIGAFKARGALNTLLALKERNHFPKTIVAYSSGNHAQAVAWAAQKLGIKATVFIPIQASPMKIAGTKKYGAEVIITSERQEAEDLAHYKATSEGAFLLPPYDHDDVIAGQGTALFEAWKENGPFDAIFAPCGGGGLISGTFLATRFFSDTAMVYAAEPKIANDATLSFNTGTIFRFSTTPKTIADGARTLGISERTFAYIKQLNGFYEISENEIIYWTQWLDHLLNITIEPTASLGMAAADCWIKEGHQDKKILIILSGSNVDSSTQTQIWQKDYLKKSF